MVGGCAMPFEKLDAPLRAHGGVLNDIQKRLWQDMVGAGCAQQIPSRFQDVKSQLVQFTIPFFCGRYGLPVLGERRRIENDDIEELPALSQGGE